MFLSNKCRRLGGDVSLKYITAISITLNIITAIITTVAIVIPVGSDHQSKAVADYDY